MKKSKFKDSQIMGTLKRVEAGLAVPEICRELGISSATLYKWRAKYGVMDTSIISRMKELELENAQLKKMYAQEHFFTLMQQNVALPAGVSGSLCVRRGETYPQRRALVFRTTRSVRRCA